MLKGESFHAGDDGDGEVHSPSSKNVISDEPSLIHEKPLHSVLMISGVLNVSRRLLSTHEIVWEKSCQSVRNI